MRVLNTELTKVCFPQPQVKELIPPGSYSGNATELGDTSPTFEERGRLLKEYAKSGFAERAVVVMKGKPSIYFTSPYNWGIITMATSAREAGKPWKPFLIRWMNNSVATRHDIEELVLIHEAVDERDMILLYNGYNC